MNLFPNLPFASLLDISKAIHSRTLSVTEITAHLLDRIDRYEPTYHAFATVCRDTALDAAAEADRELARGYYRGPLHGVPVAAKDLLWTSDCPTASGTRIFAGWRPAEDATAIAKLRRAGAVLIGKAQLTEAASIAHHPDYAVPVNPWGADRCAGFSSSGSGVAVASGFCYCALGSDTGGSIRIPSAMNGTTGLKPTWGRVSRHGVFPLVEYLDTVGPLARSAADAAAVLKVIAGQDPADPTSVQEPVPDYLAEIERGISGVVIGFDPAYLERCCDPQILGVVQKAADTLAGLGARVRNIDMPELETMALFPLMSAGIAEVHRDLFVERPADYGPDFQEMLEMSRKISGMDVATSINRANVMKGGLASLFSQIDLLLVPATARPTPKAGVLEQAMVRDTGMIMDMFRFTLPFNVSGQPTITLPGGRDDNGMPVAFQLVGRHFAESLLFQAGHAFQQITDWHVQRPPIDS